MDNEDRLSDRIGTIALSTVLFWWGLALLIDPITIGMTSAGTGLILIAANAARYLKGIPMKTSTTKIGLVAFVWGIVDHVFALSFGTSLAAILIIIGLAVLRPLTTRPRGL
jgi:hypothetical protein